MTSQVSCKVIEVLLATGLTTLCLLTGAYGCCVVTSVCIFPKPREDPSKGLVRGKEAWLLLNLYWEDTQQG